MKTSERKCARCLEENRENETTRAPKRRRRRIKMDEAVKVKVEKLFNP
jgi:hypothetical protein